MKKKKKKIFKYFLNNSLPSSRCSLPTQRKRKEGVSDILSISKVAISSKVQDLNLSIS